MRIKRVSPLGFGFEGGNSRREQSPRRVRRVLAMKQPADNRPPDMAGRRAATSQWAGEAAPIPGGPARPPPSGSGSQSNPHMQ